MPLSAILPRKNCSSRGAIYWHRKTINLFGFVREARCQASLLAPEPRESHGRAGGRFLTLPDRRLQTARNLAGGPADYALTIAVKPVEEGTPFIPAHGSRRITFVPKPSGYRFYHTHAGEPRRWSVRRHGRAGRGGGLQGGV